MKGAGMRWDLAVCCAIFTALGIAGGFLLKHAAAPPALDGDAGHEAHQAGPAISPQALKNLNVEIAAIQPQAFVLYRTIPAVIAETPFNDLPVYAPIGGRVEAILVKEGMVVKPGQTLLRLVREPLPRPELSLTDGVLKPAKDELDAAIADLRRASEEVRIHEAEWERLQRFQPKAADELPVLPQKTLIDLHYELDRAKKARERARTKLAQHGYSAEQIGKLEAGGAVPPLDAQVWKRALEGNGLWPREAEALFAALPPQARERPWTVAAIGELSAAGLNGSELAEWFKAEPHAAARLLEIATLLQRGHSVADLRRLHAMNALEPLVEIKAPAGAPDYDIHELAIKPGAHARAGEVLLVLSNPRQMFLKTIPVGGEAADLLRAVESQSDCSAAPLVEGTGPALEHLHITYVASDEHQRGTVGFAEVPNEPLAVEPGEAEAPHRTWKLRPGLRYTLRVPVRKLDKVYVLPSGAVTEDGAEKVVFVQDQGGFRTERVEIAYRDHEHAVIAINKNTTLFPGDSVVVQGAFALGQALKSDSGGVDPHAGHTH